MKYLKKLWEKRHHVHLAKQQWLTHYGLGAPQPQAFDQVTAQGTESFLLQGESGWLPP